MAIAAQSAHMRKRKKRNRQALFPRAAGRSALLFEWADHGRARPGHPPSAAFATSPGSVADGREVFDLAATSRSFSAPKHVGGRDKPGHDGQGSEASPKQPTNS